MSDSSYQNSSSSDDEYSLSDDLDLESVEYNKQTSNLKQFASRVKEYSSLSFSSTFRPSAFLETSATVQGCNKEDEYSNSNNAPPSRFDVQMGRGEYTKTLNKEYRLKIHQYYPEYVAKVHKGRLAENNRKHGIALQVYEEIRQNGGNFYCGVKNGQNIVMSKEDALIKIKKALKDANKRASKAVRAANNSKHQHHQKPSGTVKNEAERLRAVSEDSVDVINRPQQQVSKPLPRSVLRKTRSLQAETEENAKSFGELYEPVDNLSTPTPSFDKSFHKTISPEYQYGLQQQQLDVIPLAEAAAYPMLTTSQVSLLAAIGNSYTSRNNMGEDCWFTSNSEIDAHMKLSDSSPDLTLFKFLSSLSIQDIEL